MAKSAAKEPKEEYNPNMQVQMIMDSGSTVFSVGDNDELQKKVLGVLKLMLGKGFQFLFGQLFLGHSEKSFKHLG